MSMWLSAANSAAGPARGFWTAEVKRQQKAWMDGMIRAYTAPMTGGKKTLHKRSGSKSR
jgi:hypothetical protein